MRMRKKPNLIPRMERASAVQIETPESYQGNWRASFPQYDELHLELGCGKGRFTADTAELNPNVFLVAVEKVRDAMVVGMERATERGLTNVRFVDMDVAQINEVFAPNEVNRIYLNFCDPWPKSRDAKHRLTAPGFLRKYASVLPINGQIHFKTDNLPLFQWSLEQFQKEGWTLTEVSNDLHENGICGVMTDYEAKFHEQGIKINRLVAIKTAETKTTADGIPARLYDSGLSDARGKQPKESEK